MSPLVRPHRTEPLVASNEEETLWSMLNYYRLTLVTKCAGLSDRDLCTRAVPPSNLSLLGLLRHMSDVEVYWFSLIFAGVEAKPPFDPENIGNDFDNPSQVSGDDVLEIFRQCVSRSNELVTGTDLDALSVNERGSQGKVNLRFIVVHLIEEYARHCGHADLLREVLDGETGD